eukprot:166978-Hanusia_phi.AAC.1
MELLKKNIEGLKDQIKQLNNEVDLHKKAIKHDRDQLRQMNQECKRIKVKLSRATGQQHTPNESHQAQFNLDDGPPSCQQLTALIKELEPHWQIFVHEARKILKIPETSCEEKKDE